MRSIFEMEKPSSGLCWPSCSTARAAVGFEAAAARRWRAIYHDQTYHAPGRSGKAAARSGAADRAAAMGGVAMDAASQRPLAEAAVSWRRDPQRHASTKDPDTWTDYATALAAVQAGHADGISYVLTEDDPFAAIDLDHCRHVDTHSIDVWAQNFLDCGRHTYSRSDAERRRLPDLGTGRRRCSATGNSRWRSTASRSRPSCSAAPAKR